MDKFTHQSIDVITNENTNKERRAAPGTINDNRRRA
jgi:hypothetical protein